MLSYETRASPPPHRYSKHKSADFGLEHSRWGKKEYQDRVRFYKGQAIVHVDDAKDLEAAIPDNGKRDKVKPPHFVPQVVVSKEEIDTRPRKATYGWGEKGLVV